MTKTTKSKPKAKPKAEPKKIGRPPEPVPQGEVDQIIAWISEGNTLRGYCRQEGKPSFRTVYDWLEKDTEFSLRFARAREVGAECIADDVLNIIDTDPDKAPSGAIDSAYVNWKKAQAEIRLKLLAKWFPQKYGDKMDVNHAGGVTISVGTGIPEDEEKAR